MDQGLPLAAEPCQAEAGRRLHRPLRLEDWSRRGREEHSEPLGFLFFSQRKVLIRVPPRRHVCDLLVQGRPPRASPLGRALLRPLPA